MLQQSLPPKIVSSKGFLLPSLLGELKEVKAFLCGKISPIQTLDIVLYNYSILPYQTIPS